MIIGLGEVAHIGGEDLGGARANCSRRIAQCRDLGFARCEAERGRRRTGAPTDLGHLCRQIRLSCRGQLSYQGLASHEVWRHRISVTTRSSR